MLHSLLFACFVLSWSDSVLCSLPRATHENTTLYSSHRTALLNDERFLEPTKTLATTKTVPNEGYSSYTSAPGNVSLAQRDGFNPFAILSVPDTDTPQPTQQTASDIASILQLTTYVSSKTRHSSASLNSTSTGSSSQSSVTSTSASPGRSAASSSSVQAASTSTDVSPAKNTTDNSSQNSTADPDRGALSQWKVIGIAVISVTAVAAVILGSLYFDHWWTNFLRPMILRRKRSSGYEDFMPDWSTGTWRYDIKEKGDRYPSMASFTSLMRSSKPQEPQQFQIKTPFTAHSHGVQSHVASDEKRQRLSYNSDTTGHIQSPQPVALVLPRSSSRQNFRFSRTNADLMTSNMQHAPERSPDVCTDDAYGGMEF